jgi:hypothetical protein
MTRMGAAWGATAGALGLCPCWRDEKDDRWVSQDVEAWIGPPHRGEPRTVHPRRSAAVFLAVTLGAMGLGGLGDEVGE